MYLTIFWIREIPWIWPSLPKTSKYVSSFLLIIIAAFSIPIPTFSNPKKRSRFLNSAFAACLVSFPLLHLHSYPKTKAVVLILFLVPPISSSFNKKYKFLGLLMLTFRFCLYFNCHFIPSSHTLDFLCSKWFLFFSLPACKGLSLVNTCHEVWIVSLWCSDQLKIQEQNSSR